MYIVMGSDSASNTQPAASPGRWLQAFEQYANYMYYHIIIVAWTNLSGKYI